MEAETKHYKRVMLKLSGEALANLSAASLLIVAPLIIIYLFGQKYLIQGIERSGIVG